jgi:phage gp36-like protein
MAYCTEDDLLEQLDEARLIQLTDDQGLGAVDSDRVARAIADADQEVDSYVGTRHTVPLNPVPAIIRKLSVDIALYNLYGRREAVPEARRDRYKTAIHKLEQVAAGRISLGAQDPEGTPPAIDETRMSTDNPERLFSRSTMEGF